jgi:hypothetical protein
MSIARHHNKWLKLVETSGPLLGLPVLMCAFPQGLDPVESDIVQIFQQLGGTPSNTTLPASAPVPGPMSISNRRLQSRLAAVTADGGSVLDAVVARGYRRFG